MLTPLAIAYILARVVAGLDDPVGRTQLAFQVHHDFHLADDKEIIMRPTSLMSIEEPALTIRTRPTMISRPKSPDLVQQARWSSMQDGLSMALEWEEVLSDGPDIEDRHTLSQVRRSHSSGRCENKQLFSSPG
jgi:hypothetical protein